MSCVAKTCGCGEAFSAEQWSQLAPARRGLRDGFSNLVYRQCPKCDSTITVEANECERRDPFGDDTCQYGARVQGGLATGLRRGWWAGRCVSVMAFRWACEMSGDECAEAAQ